jgi:hypothetical protein
MSFHNANATPGAPASADGLVVAVYRCAMAGFAYGHATCWDIGWRTLADEMPLDQARGLFGEFHHFVRTLLSAANRPLEWRPATCRGLCDDEAWVLRMIEAAQTGDRAGMSDVAARHLDAGELAACLEAAQSLSAALSARNLFVSAPQAPPGCLFRRVH